jgi:predicted tellurium resistance membrane protein TerC
MDEIFTTYSLVAVGTLTILEIVLGIDNVVFLAILAGKLPPSQQARARTVGLMLAAAGRIALLFAISWVISLDQQVLFTLPFEVPGQHSTEQHAAGHGGDEQQIEGDDSSPEGTPISAKDVVLLLGGLFLLGKSTWEIGHQLEGHADTKQRKAFASFGMVLAQILAIDVVFSIDSVLTAVGMIDANRYTEKWVPLTLMSAAVVISIAVMIAFSGPVARFVNRHPSVKMLALSFLILIGVVLIAEGLHTHVPRGYIYFSMGFALLVEMLNLRAARARKLAAE